MVSKESNGMSEGVDILVVEDSSVQARYLLMLLEKDRYRVKVAQNGEEALLILKNRLFSIVITDWVMPTMEGPDLIKKIRSLDLKRYVYTILLTSKNTKDDLVKGMEAGADDFLTKPYDADELKVRLRAGERILKLEKRLAEHNAQLESALMQVKKLSGLLPICSACKNIRDDKGYWHRVEEYIREHSEATFTHGFCPDCMEKLYPEIYESMKDRGPA
jgi:sigma-B regulation protein RsbU (phosphoserine phosphatase)